MACLPLPSRSLIADLTRGTKHQACRPPGNTLSPGPSMERYMLKEAVVTTDQLTWQMFSIQKLKLGHLNLKNGTQLMSFMEWYREFLLVA
ncbi:unnamed protein product [Microthlaspi erraticum]|uniref:Uncharacterized protein n=1 Tax=Microthlaspi erraticum TaxID=1685480 RepID=A0A6D2J2W4_9BRAS|nr:unnamed protein product [Microthlaspi erraticum]